MTGVANVEALLAHGEWVRDLVRHLVFDREVEDDVVQQTYLAALEHPPARLESPRGWLAQVARRFAFQAYRKEVHRRRAEPLAARPEATPAHDVDRRIELHRMIVDAVATLQPPYRAVVVMRYFEGLPPRDIARKLGLPVTTVRNRLSRALDQLRARFDEGHGGRATWSAALLPLAVGPKAASPAHIVAAALALLLAGATAVLLVRDSSHADSAAPAASDPTTIEPMRAISPPEAEPDRAVAVAEAPSLTTQGVRGRVLRPDGSPAGGATVALLHPLRRIPKAEDWFTRSRREFEPTLPVATTIADTTGAWTLRGVEAGAYDVMAEIAGVGRAIAEGVEVAIAMADVESTLQPLETVACIAVDAEGSPIPGVEVAIHHQRSFDPHFNRPRTELLITDAAGRFTFARARGDLLDARLLFVERLQGPGCWQQVSLRKSGYAAIFSAPLSGQPIDQDGQIAFVMQRGRRFEIAFRSEDPIDDALRCMLRVDSAHFQAIAVTDDRQEVVFDDVPEGSIAGIVLDSPGWAMMRNPVIDGMRSRFCARQYRVPKTGTVRMDVIVHRGASISGLVVDDSTGAPVQGVAVVAFPNASYLASRSHLVRVTSDSDGRFALSGLTAIWNEIRVSSEHWHAPAPEATPMMPEAPEAGLPQLDAAPPIVATRRSAELALVALPDPEAPIRDLIIRVRKAGRVSGTVVDAGGNPVPGTRVSIESSEAALRLWPAAAGDEIPIVQTLTDSSGTFELAGAPSGTQRVVARSPGCPPAFSEPFGLEVGGATRIPPIPVHSGDRVVVRVRSTKGRPVAGLGVKIYAGRFPREFIGLDDFAGRTDASGMIAALTLPTGPICLAVENATADGLVLAPSFRSTFVHDARTQEEIIVEMVEPAWIRGIVQREDGSPVAHATVVATPAAVSREDFKAIEDMIGRGPIDWTQPGTEDGLRELSGIRPHTDASGTFSARVNSNRPLVVRRVERWRRGDRKAIETFDPLDSGAMLVPDGPSATTITVKPSRR